MIQLHELLKNRGFDFDKKTKIIKHKDSRIDLATLIRQNKILFEAYQSDQSKQVYNCDQIISCVKNEWGVQLVGLYSIRGFNPGARHPLTHDVEKHCIERQTLTSTGSSDSGGYYDMVQIPGFEDINERVILDWGGSDLAWHQWYGIEKDKTVIEILPAGYVMEWPGFLEILIMNCDLKRIASNPTANRHWINRLSSVSGIYLITDNSSGQLYVGSASGENGIWGRWAQYASNGHGENVELKNKILENPNYINSLSYSILHVLPKNAGKHELYEYENLYKNKFGSRRFGLNSN